MSLLNYSHTLVAGTPENVNDVQDMFSDVRTLVNGNLDATNLASGAKPADLMGVYRTVGEGSFNAGGLTTGNTYYLQGAGGGTGFSGTTGSSFPVLFPVTAAAYAVTGLTVKMRLRVAWATNAVAPTGTWTFGLYPITTAGGAGSITVTLGTVVSGSTVARAAPAASSRFVDASSDFTLPADGAYAVGFVLTANQAANSYLGGSVILEARNV